MGTVLGTAGARALVNWRGVLREIGVSKPATVWCFIEESLEGESTISAKKWLAALDDFRNWLIHAA